MSVAVSERMGWNGGGKYGHGERWRCIEYEGESEERTGTEGGKVMSLG